ncbi:MAG TPA: HDOD domain-containing protein, partial [Desulfurivibrionaceae bacterium]|nr:HDOD domain-containing protein [Desulfurivibrionaceae bacterium]
NVQELISLTHSSRSAAYELAKVILKDYSLTKKVLQVVNSAYYSLGRPVNSISKAVTILGFDAVRDLATAIALFEDFIRSGLEKESISKILTRSFLSAIQARDLAFEKDFKVAPEEAFICSLLHNLGKIIVCIYLPDRYREIEEKIKGGMNQAKAAKAVLDDLTFEEIGVEVAAFWNLSERVIAAMKVEPGQPRDIYDSVGYLQNLSSFSNQLVDHICEEKSLDGLMATYGDRLSINKEEALVVVNRSVEASEDISDSIRYGLSKLKIRSRLRYAEDVVRNPERAKKRKMSEVEEEEDEQIEGEEPREEAVEVLDDLAISQDKSINDFIHDITETLMGPFNINDFYINLLEGLYRGVGFDRVLLAIMSIQADKKVLVGRFGLGDIDPAGIANFEYNLNVPGVIPQALKSGKDMAIPPNTAGAFPENMKYLVKDRVVYLFPICLDGKPIGMIYLDRKKGRPKLDAAMVKATRLFRDFAVMAIRKLRGGKK